MMSQDPTPPVETQAAKPAEEKEEVYFEGSPSVWSSGSKLLPCLVISIVIAAGSITAAIYGYTWALIGFPIAIGVLFIPRWFVHSTRYRITNYRIDHERGLLSKNIDTLELWHVEDISFHQSLLDRMRGVGNIIVMSNDDTSPELVLHGLPNARPVFEALKERVIVVKRQRGVIKVDTGR